MSFIKNNYNYEINIDKLMIGVFFLIYPTFAYAIFGNTLKYICLFTGIYFVITSINLKSIFKLYSFFTAKSIFIFLLLVLISFLNNQETKQSIFLIFDLIVLILFLSGYLLGKQKTENIFFNNVKLKVLFSILTLIGSFFIFKIQSIEVADETSRTVVDTNLNSNGIAYVAAQFILIFFWFLKNEKNKIVNLFLILSIISLCLVLMNTESRGAVLFLFLTLLLVINLKVLKLKTLFFIFISIYLSYLIISQNVFLQNKLLYFSDRVETAIDFFENKNITDNSILERVKLQKYFFENYTTMFLGQYNYKHYPHNMFIEIFMRWGLFGIPIFALCFISLFKFFKIIVSKSFLKNSLFMLILSFFIFTFLQSMTSLNLENNRLIWLGFGFLLSYKI